MPRAGADALLVLAAPWLLDPHRRDLAALALQSRRPARDGRRRLVEAGGLRS
jgi:hypothetical protein